MYFAFISLFYGIPLFEWVVIDGSNIGNFPATYAPLNMVAGHSHRHRFAYTIQHFGIEDGDENHITWALHAPQ